MCPADALISEFESRHENFEDGWCLPWSENCQPEPIWKDPLVRKFENAQDTVFDEVAGQLLEHESFALQGIAIHLIAARPRTDFLHRVRDLLHSPSLQVRALVAKAIGTVQDPEGIETLLDTKDNEHAEVKKAVVDAFCATGDTRSIPLLARWVGRVGEDDELRRKACAALGSIGDVAAMPVLARVIEDDTVTSDVRSQAAIAVGRIGGAESLDLLRGCLLHGRPAVQASCLAAVATVKAHSLIPTVVEVSTTAAGTTETRQAAMRVLAELGGSGVFRPLSALAQDPDPMIRLTACSALGSLSDPRVPATIAPLLHDDDSNVQLAALRTYASVTGLSLDLPSGDGEAVDKKAIEAAVAKLGRQGEGAEGPS